MGEDPPMDFGWTEKSIFRLLGGGRAGTAERPAPLENENGAGHDMGAGTSLGEPSCNFHFHKWGLDGTRFPIWSDRDTGTGAVKTAAEKNRGPTLFPYCVSG